MSRSSVVEVATAPLERSGEGQVGWSVPKTIQYFQMRLPSLLEMQMVLRNHSIRLQDGCNLLRTVGVGDSSG